MIPAIRLPRSLRIVCLTLCQLCVLLAVAPAAAEPAAPTAAATAPDVASANAHLKRAEVNLNLVDGSIGHFTKPPKGSAGKLAAMRLDQALGDVDAAGKLLGALTEGAGLAEAKKRHADAVALHTKLRKILTGEPPKPDKEDPPKEDPPKVDPPKEDPPKEGPETNNPPKEQEQQPAPKETVRLGYPHADNFKNTLFTLRRVEGDVAGLMSELEQHRPIEDQLSINHRKSGGVMAAIIETRRQAGFVKDGLAKIPANGEGVDEAKQRLVNAHAAIDGAEAYFKPLHAKLMILVDPANYPELNADAKRLNELASSYNNPGYLFRDARPRAAEAYMQADAAKAECVRMAKIYVRLIEQQTEFGKRIEIAGNSFLRAHENFLATAKEQRESLPADIRADLVEADRMANEAVQDQKPMWFTGGIPQRMEWVDDKLALLQVLDPQNGPALEKEVVTMKASLSERADSLKALIIRENPLPLDRYTGADREAIVAVAMDAWKIQEPDYELLAVHIPSEAWSRDTRWTYSSGTWYYVDASYVQVRLIVADKQNPEQAIDRPINVRKDHQKGDTMIGVPMRSFDESLEPSEYFLRAKIK